MRRKPETTKLTEDPTADLGTQAAQRSRLVACFGLADAPDARKDIREMQGFFNPGRDRRDHRCSV